jgi:uncharacterized protein (TIGR02118 family)
MAKLITLYHAPADPQAFDEYYFSRHVPLAKKIPGLRSFEVSNGPIATPSGMSQYHLVGLLGFETFGAIQEALGSPEGQAAGADLANFADGGVDLLVFDTRDV